MQLERAGGSNYGDFELNARPGRLVKPRPKQGEGNAEHGKDQNGRRLRLHLLTIKPELGAASGVRVRRLLIKGQLGIESQQKHEERQRDH
ncbi:MAG TPA: hypothetical protein VH196_09385 [Terriglobales bacterium]|nr:hypothetical protein [Terriglobales bacterium]